MTENSPNGDLLNTDEVCCRYGIGRVVTSGVSIYQCCVKNLKGVIELTSGQL